MGALKPTAPFPSMSRVAWRLLAPALVCLAACTADPPPVLVVIAAPADEAVARAYVTELPIEPVGLVISDDPVAALATDAASGAPAIALVSDLDCVECYRVEHHASGAVVHGDAPAGVQYGLTHVLEAMGFRFFHPQRAHVPAELALPPSEDPLYGVDHAPEMTQRGLHLHTLHPTEAYYAFLEPSEAHLAEARRIIDWVVKQRGNFVRWWLLDDLESGDAAADAVRAHTAAIVEYAHLRGVRTGVSVQLFAGANLQRGFDLVEGGEDFESQIDVAYGHLDGIGFDAIQISFGEFSGEAPDHFIEVLNYATDAAIRRWPGLEVAASIHVGNYPDLRVDYMGETDFLYYFLVQFADPRIIPSIHTVMYYDLFHSAGGAYLHEDFSEHREYLYERLRAGEPVSYYPESAYWVSFDNSVPTYLPVYLRARLFDQQQIRADVEAMGMSPLERHVTFSSGWEWGYWQTDYVTLRSHYRLPASLDEAVDEMLAPLDEGAFADAIVAVAELQHQHLVVDELAPYLAGRDSTLDLGFAMDIVSIPDRARFEELHVAPVEERDAFATRVIDGLRALADGTEAARTSLPEAPADPFLAEITDGLEVDVHRARCVAALYEAVIADARGDDPSALLATADAELAAAEAVIARRHAALWDPSPERVLARRYANSTLYQYGYLREASLSCFWVRERAQVRNLLLDAAERVPACVL